MPKTAAVRPEEISLINYSHIKIINRKMDQTKLVKRFIIGTFVTLYTLVSVISTIHVIDFFQLSNPYWLAVTLAIGFELGAAASLASLVILDRMNRTLVWTLFTAITLMQVQGNMYYAFTNLQGFESWSELFGLIEEEPIYQKRILAAVSGAILPLVALGFIKSLVDYIKPREEEDLEDYVSEESAFGEMLDPQEKPQPAETKYDIIDELGSKMDRDEIDEWEAASLQDLDEQDWSDYDLDPIDPLEEVVDPLEDQVESDEDLLEQARRRLADENMQQFLKEKRDGAVDSI
jgi:hypothetical protein